MRALDIARQEAADIARCKVEADAATLAKATLEPTQTSGPIDWKALTQRARTVLQRSGCETAEHVRGIGTALLPRLPGCGDMTAAEIIAAFGVTDEHETEAADLRQRMQRLQEKIIEKDWEIGWNRKNAETWAGEAARLKDEIRKAAQTERTQPIFPAELPPQHIQEMLRCALIRKQVNEPPTS